MRHTLTVTYVSIILEVGFQVSHSTVTSTGMIALPRRWVLIAIGSVDAAYGMEPAAFKHRCSCDMTILSSSLARGTGILVRRRRGRRLEVAFPILFISELNFLSDESGLWTPGL